jgi:putative colanic acid biosynthesis acetyltransferase WcaF
VSPPEVETRSARRKLRSLAEVLFNMYGTHIPVHRVRLAWLRLIGARLGARTTILRGTTVLGANRLRAGARCSVGWRCYLDARGGITLGDDVVISSDAQIITADHNCSSPHFEPRYAPVVVESYAWLATRSLVLKGVTVYRAGVVAAGGVATRDVEAGTIVGGVPAKPIGAREGTLAYSAEFRVPLW